MRREYVIRFRDLIIPQNLAAFCYRYARVHLLSPLPWLSEAFLTGCVPAFLAALRPNSALASACCSASSRLSLHKLAIFEGIVNVFSDGRTIHAGHFGKIGLCLRQAAVRDEVVEQPEVAARVIRVRRDEFAVIGDTQGVIVHAPVAKRAAGRLAELAVGILLRRTDGKRLSGIFRRQRVVLLRLMVVQLGAQAPAAAGAVARLDARLQKALGPLQLGLRQQTAVPDLVLDAVELIVVRQAEQLVERDAKEDGDVRQELDVRRRRAGIT